MTGILKVDTIQKNNGTTPTAKDLGLNVTGNTIQTGYGVLRPGRDFNTDISTTSTSYINLAGNVSGTVLSASLNNVQSTSSLLFTYTCGLVTNSSDNTNRSSMVYNIWETNSQKYVANTTNWTSSNDPYIAGHWESTWHTGLVTWTFLAEPGFFSGNCNFQVRIRSLNGGIFWYHWHSTRVGHFFTVQEIAG